MSSTGKMKFSLVCFILFHLLSLLGLAQTESSPLWYRGNTHTHTLNSDGDSTPDEVVGWYRERGFHFIVLTDHELVTPVEGLNSFLKFRRTPPRIVSTVMNCTSGPVCWTPTGKSPGCNVCF